jgi:hypothetical protein
LKFALIAMAIIAALLMAAPSYAEWRAVPADESIKVAQDKIEVVPNMEWNRVPDDLRHLPYLVNFRLCR